jgi:phosphatidylglycerophosphate synthase
MNTPKGGRRILKTRNTPIAKNTAQWLSKKNITPNQISILGIGVSLLASICLFLIPTAHPIVALLAALLIQGRLLCNLLDGMVAVEGGKKTFSGELFNDIPDRISDILIFIAAGYAITYIDWGITLGVCTALMAVMTAYVRTLATSIGAPANYQGPMAKQHRMAVLTAACVLTVFEDQGLILLIALIVINIGSLITIFNRVMAAYTALESPKIV